MHIEKIGIECISLLRAIYCGSASEYIIESIFSYFHALVLQRTSNLHFLDNVIPFLPILYFISKQNTKNNAMQHVKQ